MSNKWFLSFVEYGIFGEKSKSHIGGRLEVYDNENQMYPYAQREYHYFTDKKEEYYKFREKWDFMDVGKWELRKILRKLKEFQR